MPRCGNGNVTTILRVFNGAKAFNQDIGGWNVGNVTSMRYMFNSVPVFKQDISRWNVAKVTDLTNFLAGGSLPTDYYNLLLMRWSRQTLKPTLTFHGGTSKYDLGAPSERRQYIMDTFGWNIYDGGSTGQYYQYDPTSIVVR